MCVDVSPAAPPFSNGRIILGSFLSALAGWVTLTVLPLGAYFLRSDDYPGTDLWNFLIVPMYAGFFILPVWFVVLLPLYRYVPTRSVLWRWPICTLCGAVVGGAIMLAFCAPISIHLADGLPLIGLASLVGAATCLFGSLTRRWFCPPAAA